jgi:hypothetical protein
MSIKNVKPYDLSYINGIISIEKELKPKLFKGSIGLQVSRSGKIWLCIDRQAVIRVSPETKAQQFMKTE